MHASRRWTRRARRMLQLRGAAGALAGTPLERALRKGKRRTDKMHSVKDEIAGWEMVAGQEKFFLQARRPQIAHAGWRKMRSTLHMRLRPVVSRRVQCQRSRKQKGRRILAEISQLAPRCCNASPDPPRVFSSGYLEHDGKWRQHRLCGVVFGSNTNIGLKHEYRAGLRVPRVHLVHNRGMMVDHFWVSTWVSILPKRTWLEEREGRRRSQHGSGTDNDGWRPGDASTPHAWDNDAWRVHELHRAPGSRGPRQRSQCLGMARQRGPRRGGTFRGGVRPVRRRP